MAKTSGPSLSAQAYDRIRADILGGGFASGQRIKISDLVRELGFSLGAVREALSRLGSEGLVTAETNKGYCVARLSAEELDDLTETRLLIESECLSRAIRNGDLKWESGIVAAQFEMSRLPIIDPQDQSRVNPAWNAAHTRFHAALVAACDSPWLLQLREMLFVQSERYRVATVSHDGGRRDLAAEHRRIAEKAIARDEAAAVEALRAHLGMTRKILLETGVAPRGGEG
ncbi:GntR family transcriptional regulator [Pseudogemmobacter sonorensis]|uniref:GntR family transcriptional regulator n=1 Tax=Pseudogemmobacter sonorensis TaxID=2989681 RepID=UPI003681B262